MVDSNSQEASPSDSNDSIKHKSRNWQGKWPKTPGRLLGIGVIRFYQLTLSGFIGNGCRHQPTCSEYGYEAIARYGLLYGGWLTLLRFAKCGPWGTSGFDPVPHSKKR
ncbi:MAG: membrane protein insertion efficiency factor YidD [Rhizobiaceae bacterium]